MTHNGVGLPLEAIRSGFTAEFVTADELITSLVKGARLGRLESNIRRYVTPVDSDIDGIACLPLDEVGATLLFQLVTARYERGSIDLTSIKTYGVWGYSFGETVMATARLLHHATTFNIRGDSYRMKVTIKAGLLHTLEGREKDLQK